MKKIITKSIKPLKKLVAKQAVKLGAAAVPFLGWAMAAWTVYDIVNIGLDLKKAIEQYDVLGGALEKCLKKKKAPKQTTTKNTKGNKLKVKKEENVGKEKNIKNKVQTLMIRIREKIDLKVKEWILTTFLQKVMFMML